MIKYRDFAPTSEELGLLGKPALSSLDSAVEQANQWITAFDVDVVNIETVVLPNMHDESTTDQAELEHSTYWYQIVRVWHRDEPAEHGDEIRVFDEPSEVT
jgi:hypothetical protein